MLSEKWTYKMKSYFNFIFIVLSILFQACGGIFGKYVSITIDSLTIFAVISNIFYILSLFCLFLQAIVWQQALKHYRLSFAYPFMSLVNFVILLPAHLLFDESITAANIIGLAVISTGIYFLSRDSGREVRV